MGVSNIYNQLYCKNPTYICEISFETPILKLMEEVHSFFKAKGKVWNIKYSEVYYQNSYNPISASSITAFLSLIKDERFQDFFIDTNSFFLGENLMDSSCYKDETMRFVYLKEKSTLEVAIHLDVFANKVENVTEPEILDISDIAPTNRDLLKTFLSYLLEKSQGEIIWFGGHYEGFQSKLGIDETAVSKWY